MTLDLNTASVIASTILYAVIAAIALIMRPTRGVAADWLALYAVSAALWGALQMGGRLDWYTNLRPDLVERVPPYAVLMLAGLLLHFTSAFLRQGEPGWTWLGLLGAWLVLSLLLELNVLGWPDVFLITPGMAIIRQGMVEVVLILGWAMLLGSAALLTLRTFRRTQQPLHRNRIAYWVPVLFLSVVGDGLLFAGRLVTGNTLVTLATVVAAYATLNHRLPDVREAVRRTAAYVLTMILVGAGFVSGINATQTWLRAVPAEQLFLIQVVLAVALAMLFSPLRRLVQSAVNRIILKRDYDPGRAVREYSISISNILDVNQLAHVALDIIRETLGASHGRFFLVDRKVEDGNTRFLLRSVGDPSPEARREGALQAENPVAEFLYKEFRPLTQYDIDLLPRFQDQDEAEHGWLSELAADVYVPIYSKGNWIGLFALGPKVNRDRYFDDDLNLLSTLADQTTVALENARLVDNLVQLNRTLREAYGALDQANKQLEQLDRAKSDFIAVLSHELRTPMGILLGYSQLLAADPDFASNPANQPIIDGLNKGATRLQEMIELMLDMATVDNQVLKLYHKPVPIWPIVRAAGEKFSSAMAERRLNLIFDEGLIDLPQIEADTELLTKVFYHLIVNAIKYTPDGGRITVSGKVLPIGNARLPEGGVEVIVADTGIGIDPQFHELIFAKFYSTGDAALHSSGKTKFKGGGPGLGLAIARGIVEAHGGQIWVESPGHDEVKLPGSQFHVALPIRSKLGRSTNGTGREPNPLNVETLD